MNTHLRNLYLLVGLSYILLFSQIFEFGKTIDKKSADRFAGSEAVWVMDKLNEQGTCINYTQAEVEHLYKDKKLSERKVFQALKENKWKCNNIKKND